MSESALMRVWGGILQAANASHYAAAWFGLYMAARSLRTGMKKPKVTDKVVYDKETRKGVTGVVLVNLGTPEGTSVSAVRRFLREFLMDERVIDAPPYIRWMLVNCLIAPFRAPGSAGLYKRIWDESKSDSNLGSPIMAHGLALFEGVKAKLEKEQPGKYSVQLAMRYQSPSIEQALLTLKRQCVEHIIILPLFPQYSSSCTGSIHAKVFEILSTWDRIPHLTFNSSMLELPGFVDSFAVNAKDLMQREYDHYVFSYHGIPMKQITKGCHECKLDDSCCGELTERNNGCYRAQCFETTRRIAKSVGIPEGKFTTTFQSRLGPTVWLQPYTDVFVERLPSEGKKRVLVFSPAFVADCLETIDEIGSELKHSFLENGGDTLDLVPSLNATPAFVDTITDLTRKLTVY